MTNFIWHKCKADDIEYQIKMLKRKLAPVRFQYRAFNDVRDALTVLAENGWALPDGADGALRQMADELDDLIDGIYCDGMLRR
jgi:hypothetical protein